MDTGHIISGAGHIGLITWAFFGGMFTAEPLPFEVTEVTAISAEEFAVLQAAQDAPEAVSMIETPDAPEPGDAAPELASQSDPVVEMSPPDLTEMRPPDDVPVVPDRNVPEITDDAPVVPQPPEDVAVLLPEVSTRPQPRASDRIAPEPVEAPEPDVPIAEVEQPHVAPDETAVTPEPETEAAAPEEAATEIVTEAEEVPSGAPAVSLRPKTRPSRTAEASEPEPEPETPQPEQSSAIDEAIAAAAAAQQNTPPSGPALTGGEKAAFRVAVQSCWNVGSLSTDALSTVVVVAFSMSEDGKPSPASIQLVSAEGGSGAAATSAFEAARRAIIRCGARGYPLPREKYDHWRDIVITFNPENMRIK